MKNQDVRKEAQEAGVCQWEIADKLGMKDTNFSKKLRYELSETEKARIREVIAQFVKEREVSV